MSTTVAVVDVTEANVAAANQLAAELRLLADFVQRNPDLYEHLRYSGLTSRVNIPVASTDQPREVIAAFARAAFRAGREVKKDIGENHGGARVLFGSSVSMYVYAHRAQVCERVVTGTEQVTRQVPDPDALAAVPTVEVTETVEQVRWECHPILADSLRHRAPEDDPPSDDSDEVTPAELEGVALGGRGASS
jgi:hypothetical protein